VPVNGYRGVVAIQGSEGLVLAITEGEMQQAQATLGKMGLWAEMSSAISFAGALRTLDFDFDFSAPIVCINTSSGFKDSLVGNTEIPLIDGTWESFQSLLS